MKLATGHCVPKGWSDKSSHYSEAESCGHDSLYDSSSEFGSSKVLRMCVTQITNCGKVFVSCPLLHECPQVDQDSIGYIWYINVFPTGAFNLKEQHLYSH